MSAGEHDVLHITTRAAWDAGCAAGAYEAPSLHSEGFIHCSRRDQLEATLARHFAGARGLVALVIEPSRLTSELKWEPAHGVLFPHVYGPINLDAVMRVEAIADRDGR